MNDINILDRSPLPQRLIDGTFVSAEQKSRIVPFEINGEEFNKFLILTDGIYPKYSRFVKGMTRLVTVNENKFTTWQSAARKAIERAFEKLEGQLKFFSHQLTF